MKDKTEYLMIKKFKDDVDPEMIADIILELMKLSVKDALDTHINNAERYSELWKEFYNMTEYRDNNIPF